MRTVRVLIYWPFTRTRGIMYVLLSAITIPVYMFNLATALSLIGLQQPYPMVIGLLITVVSLAMSAIHVVVYETKTTVYVPSFTYLTFFGMTFKIPTISTQSRRTMISLNVGGALIPVAVSMALAYMLYVNYPRLIIPMVASVALTAVMVNRVSRVVPAIGIVTPAIVPPILAAFISYMTVAFTANPYIFVTPVVAYITGVLGTLIGADLLNLRKVIGIAPVIADIGGAGTFDGIFFTGILAVFYASLVSTL
ncbi:DUF1614 domain-containing protein [Caldivirga maquilingensis]|uniref:DUF1614 domain-containing protein n=1 Tax=Caldivirga maquilingensis TaxID=76887 RepID=UPI0012E99925|nr:DUF1614 domain-containing protein [Caldivirga maquilingensis]